MPGYSVSIKERMLYSSCKNSVVEAIQKVPDIMGGDTSINTNSLVRCKDTNTKRCNLYVLPLQLYSIEIAKKVEVDGGAELTKEFLHSEIHPVSFS